MNCDCCYGEFVGRRGFRKHGDLWLCPTCRRYQDRWDGFTPEERRTEMESLMAHEAEDLTT